MLCILLVCACVFLLLNCPKGAEEVLTKRVTVHRSVVTVLFLGGDRVDRQGLKSLCYFCFCSDLPHHKSKRVHHGVSRECTCCILFFRSFGLLPEQMESLTFVTTKKEEPCFFSIFDSPLITLLERFVQRLTAMIPLAVLFSRLRRQLGRIRPVQH